MIIILLLYYLLFVGVMVVDVSVVAVVDYYSLERSKARYW